jgi:hypothetical protein
MGANQGGTSQVPAPAGRLPSGGGGRGRLGVDPFRFPALLDMAKRDAPA